LRIVKVTVVRSQCVVKLESIEVAVIPHRFQKGQSRRRHGCGVGGSWGKRRVRPLKRRCSGVWIETRYGPVGRHWRGCFPWEGRGRACGTVHLHGYLVVIAVVGTGAGAGKGERCGLKYCCAWGSDDSDFGVGVGVRLVIRIEVDIIMVRCL